jgi:hypothetical protein
MAEEDPALTGQLALETGGNLATIVTNTTGVATATNQTTGNTSLSSIATNTGASATSANQTTELASLSTIATNTGKIPSVGQTTMSASQPVVIASNQSTVPVSLATNTPTLQSGSTTAVTQATASNLNAQVVGNVPAAGADSGNGVKISGVYNTTLPTYTNGQRADLQTTANGSLQSNLNTLIAGEDLTNNKMVVEQRNVYTTITSTGTSAAIKSGANFLNSITINNPSTLLTATAASTIAIYDALTATGTPLATISLPLSANMVGAQPFNVPYNVSLNTGLTIVITLGTGGSWTPNITIGTRV